MVTRLQVAHRHLRAVDRKVFLLRLSLACITSRFDIVTNTPSSVRLVVVDVLLVKHKMSMTAGGSLLRWLQVESDVSLEFRCTCTISTIGTLACVSVPMTTILAMYYFFLHI